MRDLDRFWSKVEKGDSCWIWAGGRTKGGYGAFWLDGRTQYAHRVSFTWAKGPIPEGLELDHLCRNTACVNPEHLEAVEGFVNNSRSESATALNARAMTCPQGHDYSPENTYRNPTTGYRYCRACHRDYQRSRRLAKAS